MNTLLGVKVGGKPQRIIVWDTQDITVGRASDNDIRIDHDDVSRHHAKFVKSLAAWSVNDLGTSNGTLVNGERIDSVDPHELAQKDIIKIVDVELTYIQTGKDPSSMGLPVEYASQLKDFAGASSDPSADGNATMLGFSPDKPTDFDVDAIGSFDAAESDGLPPLPKDLDLELGDMGAPSPPSNATAATSGTLSLNLEIEGLTPELRRTVEALMGKVIELPSLRVRIKGEDF